MFSSQMSMILTILQKIIYVVLKVLPLSMFFINRSIFHSNTTWHQLFKNGPNELCLRVFTTLFSLLPH